MPSDARNYETVVEALRSGRERFRSSVVALEEELGGIVDSFRRSSGDGSGRLAAELGPFAVGRLDATALAALLRDRDAPPETALPVMERAVGVLAEALAASDERRLGSDGTLFEVRIPVGGDLRDGVRDALTRAGRIFGAARAAGLARSGRFEEEHEELFDGVPFHRWTLRERQIAPPLLVRLGSEELRPAGLGEFLDGRQTIVLLVEGEAVPPACLARLITPGVMVTQTDDPASLEAVGAFQGPAVAALFEGGAFVPFVHDPSLGSLPWERVSLAEPQAELRARFAERRWSQRSWADDLEHLLELATPPEGAPSDPRVEAAEPEVSPATSADRLASWLLARTDLSDA